MIILAVVVSSGLLYVYHRYSQQHLVTLTQQVTDIKQQLQKIQHDINNIRQGLKIIDFFLNKVQQ